MSDEKIKIVVVDEQALGYLYPDSDQITILGVNILKGKKYLTCCPASIARPFVSDVEHRLAKEQDFIDYRVDFDQYKKRPNEYEFAN